MSTTEHRPAFAATEIRISRMSEHDLIEVVEIEEESGLSRWGWAAYYAELQTGNRDLMLVACPASYSILEQRRVAGYIVARETAGELHINNVAVRAHYRRQGIGRVLLNRIVAPVSGISLSRSIPARLSSPKELNAVAALRTSTLIRKIRKKPGDATSAVTR